ncbi:MAG: glycosyltransferase [Alphaproteobacteria bacterium]|nr:glycosyltransferase [Alphaproteobacteria bacterium]
MSPRVSVVAPVYNEAGVLHELARRCLAAARRVDPEAEVVLADDASTDATQELSRSLPAGVRVVRLPTNRGQLGATKAGLAAALGEIVVVLDGDLQDPPERIPHLVAALEAQPELDGLLAVKVSRRDPLWFRLGRAGYALLQRAPGARRVPSGAGAYCALRRATARRVAACGVEQANLAPLLVALDARLDVLPYVKTGRYDGHSRVGLAGLVREALGSLALTGALAAAAGWLAALLALLGLGRRRAGPVVLAALLLGAARAATRRARRALDPSRR